MIPPQGVGAGASKEDIRDVTREELTSGVVGTQKDIPKIIREEITSGTTDTSSLLREEIRKEIQGELTSGTVGTKKDIREIIREEITSGATGTSSLLRTEIEKELRAELTSGDPATASPMYHERVRTVFDVPGSANANIFGTDYTVPYDCVLRLIGALDTDVALNYVLTRNTAAVTVGINGGSVLKANVAYAFDIPFTTNDSVNLQVAAACQVLHLEVYKIRVPGP